MKLLYIALAHYILRGDMRMAAYIQRHLDVLYPEATYGNGLSK